MIIEGRAVLEDGIALCQVRIENDVVFEIQVDVDQFSEPDLRLNESWILSPGLIDAQINGAFGKEFKTDRDSISYVSSRIVKFGVTGFLPTVTTKEPGSYAEHLRALSRDASSASGARVLGIHIEGPALNHAKKGAHPSEWLVDPSQVDLEELFMPLVRVVTLAPELPGGWELAHSLAERGIRVGIGHSIASYDDVVANFASEYMHVVHTYNAMSELTSRAPGLVGVVLDEPDFWASVIADLVHVHPASLRVLRNSRRSTKKIFGVSDGSAVLGLANGVHRVGSRSIEKRDDRAVLAGTETLVGSVLTMNVAVRNAIRTWGCSVAEAVYFASHNSAEYLGLAEKIGTITVGKLADLCVLDGNFDAILTMVGGEIVFDNRPQRTP
ncbi:N-acetylglucosamine-6-phosphate deacetylase [Rhodococcus sp. 06-1477-1B]|nr:N-acetylglucosamine-6-phosphate deacetylase [Rhodococcus sp. 06-1477-1B]